MSCAAGGPALLLYCGRGMWVSFAPAAKVRRRRKTNNMGLSEPVRECSGNFLRIFIFLKRYNILVGFKFTKSKTNPNFFSSLLQSSSRRETSRLVQGLASDITHQPLDSLNPELRGGQRRHPFSMSHLAVLICWYWESCTALYCSQTCQTSRCLFSRNWTCCRHTRRYGAQFSENPASIHKIFHPYSTLQVS